MIDLTELTAETVGAYLQERGVIPPGASVVAEELGWGISNVVCAVRWDDAAIVVKQSLPTLRVADEWHLDRSRITIEYDCMQYLAGVLPPGSVPSVVFTDPANFAFGMTYAPPGGTLWKEALLSGTIDPSAASRAGSLLRQIHDTAAGDASVIARFADQTVLIEGRIDPYHRTAARVNPDVAPLIDAEVERLLAIRRTLVLGDYSPKNTFIYPDHVLILDFEVAHWGDPAFDVAFCLTHLVLKACKFPALAAYYLRAAAAFCSAYGDLPDGTVAELGCLLLARIDGKSKVEYITDDATRSVVRKLAKEIIVGAEATMPAVIDTVGRRLSVAR